MAKICPKISKRGGNHLTACLPCPLHSRPRQFCHHFGKPHVSINAYKKAASSTHGKGGIFYGKNTARAKEIHYNQNTQANTQRTKNHHNRAKPTHTHRSTPFNNLFIHQIESKKYELQPLPLTQPNQKPQQQQPVSLFFLFKR